VVHRLARSSPPTRPTSPALIAVSATPTPAVRHASSPRSATRPRRPRPSGPATPGPCCGYGMTSRQSKWITCGRVWQRPVCKLTDTRRTPLRVGTQVRLPQPHNLPSARPDVTVLGAVKGDTTTDAGLVARALAVVPVVAVELDDETGRWDHRVGGEL